MKFSEGNIVMKNKIINISFIFLSIFLIIFLLFPIKFNVNSTYYVDYFYTNLLSFYFLPSIIILSINIICLLLILFSLFFNFKDDKKSKIYFNITFILSILIILYSLTNNIAYLVNLINYYR